MPTDNYKKHTSKNPLKLYFINRFFKKFTLLIKDLDIESVLDVGCGEGVTLSKLKKEGIGKSWEGVDSEEEAIKIGKKMHPNLSLNKGNVYDLEYKNSSFDLVICTEVLEHLEDPGKGFEELLRVSKKYVIFSVPNEPFFYLFNYTQWGKDIGHINKWCCRRFVKFLKSSRSSTERSGTNLKVHKVISVKTPFPWTIVLLEK